MPYTANRLRLLREERDEKQATVAATLGMSRATLSNYEAGLTPSMDNAIGLAQYYGVSIDYIVGLSDDRTHVSAGMGPMFATLSNLTGDTAPSSADITALWSAAIQYMVGGQPCGLLPLTSLRTFLRQLTACLNTATQGEGVQLLDHANAAAVAALDITKMPAMMMAGKKEDPHA